MRLLATLVAISLVALAGCSTPPAAPPAPPEPDVPAAIPAFVDVSVNALANFTEQVVGEAVSLSSDLYEPTIEVSDTGVIYITGHTVLVDTTGAPVWFSKDDGATWAQLPFAGPAALPSPLHGATPPPSDEIFLAAGDDGWLYGVDITLFSYPVNAWSGDGAELAYHNPNAYPEGQTAMQAQECEPLPIKDRPWGAYENGTLLMVSNPGGGPAQIGVMEMPPALPGGVGTAATADWNLCAGPGGSIPGIPDIRADGRFAVPQMSGGSLYLVVGNKSDVMDTRIVEVFEVDSQDEITSFYGIAAFDAEGSLFVGISNNTDHKTPIGQLLIAASPDGGETFAQRTFSMGKGPIRHFYMDANENGPGALVVWAVDGDDGFDWYTAHVQVAHDGAPILENVVLAIDEGPMPSAHVTGAAVGPDGRAYLAMYERGGAGSTPLSVYVQMTGPALPSLAAVVAPAA